MENENLNANRPIVMTTTNFSGFLRCIQVWLFYSEYSFETHFSV